MSWYWRQNQSLGYTGCLRLGGMRDWLSLRGLQFLWQASEVCPAVSGGAGAWLWTSGDGHIFPTGPQHVPVHLPWYLQLKVKVWPGWVFSSSADSGLSFKSPVITSKFKRWQKTKAEAFSFLCLLHPWPGDCWAHVPHLNVFCDVGTAGQGKKDSKNQRIILFSFEFSLFLSSVS